MNILIVDGYNIIGAWDELKRIKEKDLGQARDRLIDILADYQAFTNTQVIVVFDAHYVSGVASKQKAYKIEVIYTKENETADECIEKLVSIYKNVQTQVYVATSDYMEQRITFGRGALRKSARELLIDIKEIEQQIEQKVEQQLKKKPQLKIALNQDVAERFEKWRRGK